MIPDEGRYPPAVRRFYPETMTNAARTAPHCPEDDVVMLAVPGGWRCPECGHLQQPQDGEEPRDREDPGRLR